jgi:hypothetical protein
MGLKIIHEQMVEEAQKRSRFSQEQNMPRQSWLQSIGAFFTRLNVVPARKQKVVTAPGCD